MHIRGYNGFPNLPVIVMHNTRVRGVGTQGTVYASNDYFAQDNGSFANIEHWADTHRQYLGTIDPDDPSTWIRAWSGIDLCDFSETDDKYYFSFNFANIRGVNNNETATPYSLTNQKVFIACERNKVVPVLGRVWGAFVCVMGDAWYCTVPADAPLTNEISGRFFSFQGGFNNLQPYVSNQYLQSSWYNYGRDGLTDCTLIVASQEITNSYYRTGDYICTDFGGNIANDRQSGDTSKDGGGDGNYGYEDTDDIPDDGTPTISAISSGFISLYNPNPQQLLDLRNFLYNANSSIIDKWMALTDNVFNYLVGLKLFPCSPSISANTHISMGGVDSEVSAPKLSNQYKTFDCGYVNVQECYGGFLDYANTSVKIYLPFCGEMELDTPIVMHGTVHLLYKVDFLTGDCLACIEVRDNHGVNAEVYFANGNCACDIPITGRNDVTQLTGILGVGLSMATSGASAGVSALLNPEQFAPKVQRVGNIGGAVGMMGLYTPYIIIERPAQSFPSNNNMLLGRPSNIGGHVRDFTGYTEIEQIKLDGIQATDSELEEIRTLLENGVYI